MKYIDAERLKAFKVALADVIVSAQGLCTYDACKERAEEETPVLLSTIAFPQQETPDSPIMKEFFDKFIEIGEANNFGFGPKNFLQEHPEVDSEKAIDGLTAGWIEREEYGELQSINTNRCVTLEEVKEVMRCMFELGLNARK